MKFDITEVLKDSKTDVHERFLSQLFEDLYAPLKKSSDECKTDENDKKMSYLETIFDVVSNASESDVEQLLDSYYVVADSVEAGIEAFEKGASALSIYNKIKAEFVDDEFAASVMF